MLSPEIPPDQLPPLNEDGVPKYKGKKRGRKPKVRRRKLNPNRTKRQHTGYTLFMQEQYPIYKAANPSLSSKELISMVAKEWKESTTDREAWKEKALATHALASPGEEVETWDEDDALPPARKSKRKAAI